MTQQAPSAERPPTAVDAVLQPLTNAQSLSEGSADVASAGSAVPAAGSSTARPVEIGGREGPEPTRFGDWEMRGRCIDF